MRRLFAILSAILGVTLVSGCFPRPDYRDLPDVSALQYQTVVVESLILADPAAPTDSERAAVAAALAKTGERGQRVRMLLAKDSTPLSPERARVLVSDLGIDPSVALVGVGEGDKTSVEFLRVTVSAPDCSTMVAPSEYDWTGQRPTMAFGCATLSNFGQMLADPADLAHSRRYGGAEAVTSSTAVDRYHQNQVTPLRGTSSNGGTSSSSP